MTFSNFQAPLRCNLPRRQKAIAALYCLVWKKAKKERPSWIINELNAHS